MSEEDNVGGRRLLELLLEQQRDLNTKMESFQANVVARNVFEKFTDRLDVRLNHFDKAIETNKKLIEESSNSYKEQKDEIDKYNNIINAFKASATWFFRVIITVVLGVFATFAPTYFGWRHSEPQITVPIQTPQVYTKPTPRPNGAYVQ